MSGKLVVVLPYIGDIIAYRHGLHFCQGAFSKRLEGKPQQKIAATQKGKSVIINETPSNTETYPISPDCTNQQQQPHDQSKRNGIHTNDNSEGQITTTNQGKSDEPKANVETYAINDFTTTDAVQKLLLRCYSENSGH